MSKVEKDTQYAQQWHKSAAWVSIVQHTQKINFSRKVDGLPVDKTTKGEIKIYPKRLYLMRKRFKIHSQGIIQLGVSYGRRKDRSPLPLTIDSVYLCVNDQSGGIQVR